MPRSRPGDSSLFADAGRRRAADAAPLAERLRPRSLEEIVGQGALLADGSLLRKEVAERSLRSLLLWGPPGSGKTTLARLIAREADHELVALSAVSSGVAALRQALADAEERLGATGRPTVVFVDEIHRFHKGQQDALLHEVEDGRVVLIGATTENPAFHVNGALMSRCRLVRLQALDETACAELVQRALTDEGRGLGDRALTLDDAARATLVRLAAGDGRRLLSLLERAATLAADGAIETSHVRAAEGAPALVHDKSGDAHYDLLSALHKSLRGSDPDAAAYYVQRLLAAGEDPRVVARRLVRMASEDVGLADPAALGQAVDALAAVQFLGLPEGDAALVQAAVYLALAPKSDAVYRAANAARRAVEEHGALPVPTTFRNAPTGLAKSLGHGAGYVNPHAADSSTPPSDHLPDELAGRVFYEPGDRGAEAELRRRAEEIRRRRVRPDPPDTPEADAAEPPLPPA